MTHLNECESALTGQEQSWRLLVEQSSELLHELQEVLLIRILPLSVSCSRVLPVEVEAVEAVLLHPFQGGLNESRAAFFDSDHVRIFLTAFIPTPDGQDGLEMLVFLLQVIEPLETI